MEKDESLVPYSKEIIPADTSKTSSFFDEADSILSQRMAIAKTPEELDKVLDQRNKLLEIEYRRSQLKHAENSANRKLEEAKEKRRDRLAASIASVGIGLGIIPFFPMLSPFMIILGLTKPLGYSVTEISNKFMKIAFKTSQKDGDQV
jgi:hypothetical protein